MYVATATYSSLIRPALERVGVLSFFEGIVTCSDVGHGKDRPDVFLAALKALDSDLQGAWVFEDALHAIKTAKAAGFSVCGVFDLTEAHNKDLIRELCDVYTEGFEALKAEDL